MRHLLVGTAPPPGGLGGVALAARARVLEESGEDVLVLSGDLRSAADRHARLDGALLALYLAYFARRFDALELRIEAPLATPPGRRRPGRVTLFLLAGALEHWPHVTFRVDHPVPAAFVAPSARRLFRQADEIVVGDEEDARLLERARLGRHKARVEEPVTVAVGASPLFKAVSEGREIPNRRLVVLLAYERARHLAALALKPGARAPSTD